MAGKKKKVVKTFENLDPSVIEVDSEGEAFSEEEWKLNSDGVVDMIVHDIETSEIDPKKRYLKAVVQGHYDIQSLRIRIGNTLCSQLYAKLGYVPGEKIAELMSLDKTKASDNKKVGSVLKSVREKIIKKMFSEYKLRAEGVANNKELSKVVESVKELNGVVLINSAIEEQMISHYMTLLDEEQRAKKMIKSYLEDFHLWNYYLDHISGIGELMGGVLVGFFDHQKAERPSSFLKFIGMDTVFHIDGDDSKPIDNRGRGRYKDHQIIREYTNKDGKIETKNSLSYDPWVRTKILGVMAECIMKQNTVTKFGDIAYQKVYWDAKNRITQEAWRQCTFVRLENGEIVRQFPVKPNGEEYTLADFDRYPGNIKKLMATVPKWAVDEMTKYKKDELAEYPKARINGIAKRAMVKAFLKDYWINGRIILGMDCIPEGPGYEEARLGMRHHYRLMTPDGNFHMVRGEEPIHEVRRDWDKHFGRV